MSIATIIQLWNRFWFEPCSPLPMAVFRVLYGLMVIGFCLLLWPDLYAFLGENAWFSVETVQTWSGSARFSLLNAYPADENVTAHFTLLLIAAICLTAGFFSRTSAAVVFILLVSMHHRNPFILHSGDTFMRLCAFYLMLSQCGKMLSVDAWLNRRGGREGSRLYAPWAQRLLQIQICLVYWHSTWGKFAGDTWWDGTAVYYATNLLEFRKFYIPFLLDNMFICRLLTWGALAVEISLFSLIWIRELRYWVLLAGVLLHLGIELTMNVPQFELIMICSYVVWMEPAHLQKALAWIAEQAAKLLKPSRARFPAEASGSSPVP